MGRPAINRERENMETKEPVATQETVPSKDRETPRKTRIPIDGMTKRLDVFKEIPGYRLYWANDADSRIFQMQQAGYEFVSSQEVGLAEGQVFVNDSTDTRVKRWVGMKPNGEPMFAYLMKIDMEFFNEDQKAREDEVRRRELQMYRQNAQPSDAAAEDRGSFYTPKGGLGISTNAKTSNI